MITKEIQKKIINYCNLQGYTFSKQENTFTILYVEGMNTDGSLNDDRPNHFNDIRSIWNHELECIAVWEGTTEPGFKYTYKPMNPQGAARIQFGQYRSWQVGTHKDHRALIQVRPVTVCRDLNMDFIRTGDKLETGLFGINQHWGYDLPKNDIANGFAGCLGGRTKKGHQEFMKILYTDARYIENNDFIFDTIIIPGDKI